MWRRLASTCKKLLAAAGCPAQRRKLFLLVFLWTCFCILLFRTTLFPSIATSSNAQNRIEATSSHHLNSLGQQDGFLLSSSGHHHHEAAVSSKVRARAAVSVAPAPVELINHQYNQHQINSSAIQTATNKFYSSLSSQDSVIINNNSNQLDSKAKAKTTAYNAKNIKQLPVPGSSCNYNYPSLFDLQFNNIHWQKMTVKLDNSTERNNSAKQQQQEATYYLYNAYYDDRWRGGLPSVRVLAMIDRIQPPPTNCLLWSQKLHTASSSMTSNPKLKPIVTRASFVYAWYPKWGNYKDGILQPWIVTCPITRPYVGLVPDSVSLVETPPELPSFAATTTTTTRALPTSDNFAGDALNNDDDMLELPSQRRRKRRQADLDHQASIAMPPSYSSSSSASIHLRSDSSTPIVGEQSTKPMEQVEYDCKQIGSRITNNLPVFNRRPETKEKFAVCVKGLDFPHEDVSVRLVEWIELLNLLGASKIFLYELDVHENISKVLHYYQQRGLVELSPLTLPGDQPNLPEYQHLYLKNKLTAKRQNELIPYNDCLYRNLYSYEYLALLDIDEVIMPLGRHQNSWYELMQQVEALSLSEQNYSRASYNVRNVYFFDDLSGPLGTTSTSSSSSAPDPDQQQADSVANNQLEVSSSSEKSKKEKRNGSDSAERGIPHYLHMMSHVYRSKNYTEPGQYVKCFHNTERVVSLHNHFPMNCFGQCTTYSIPVDLAHLQHYRKDCVGPLRQSCKNDFRVFTTRDTTIWKYKQRMIRRTTRVLNYLGLLNGQQRE